MPRAIAAHAAGLLVASAAGAAFAASDEVEARPFSAAVGIKAGVIPPVAAAPEVVLHARQVMLGLFGIALPAGVGRNAAQTTLGAELGFEFAEPGSNTPYVLGSYFHYDASTDPAGRYERSDALTLTGGYTWKGKYLELQLGAGALFIVNDELAPCTGWFCGWRTPPVLPTLDLSLRYRF